MRTATCDGSVMKCGICGTMDYDKLEVHNLGIAAGMHGEDYSFCKACWESKDLGANILKMLHFSSLKYRTKYLKIRGRKDGAK